jgi:Ca-activated chloride channel family protein
MAPALEAALGGRTQPGYLRQIVFVTDGAIGNEAELFALVAGHIGDARLFTVGIGPAPNQLFMEHAARAGRGTATYIGASADVGARMTELFQRISMPVLTDVAISVPDQGEILRIPDVYAGEPQTVTLKLPLGIGIVNVTGFSDGATWGQQLAIAEERDAPGVARLWARQRIRDLMLSQAGGAEPEQVREQIVTLGLGYGLTSRFTSLVAVEQTPPSGQTAARRATVPTPVAGVSFPATAAGFDQHLLFSLLCLGLGLAVLYSRGRA